MRVIESDVEEPIDHENESQEGACEWQHEVITLEGSSHVQQELEQDGQLEDGTDTNGIPDEAAVEESICTSQCTSKMQELISKINLLEEKLFKATFSMQLLGANDKYAKFFTGLPSWKIFYHLYNFIAPHAGKSLWRMNCCLLLSPSIRITN